MRKFSVIFSLIAVFLNLAYTAKSISEIKYVTAGKMNKTDYAPVINVTGEFINTDKSYVMFSVPLYIKEVFVKENSYVNKGQALFTVDKEKIADVLSNGLSEDIFSLLNSIDLNRLKSSINSTYTDKIMNLPDTVYAPESGIVSSVNITSGGFVLPNQHIIEITASEDMRAKFTLSQTDYGKIEIGNAVKIIPIAFNNVSYTGVITDDNAVIKKQNSMVGSKTVVEVFASISQPDSIVSDGLQINGTIYCGDKAQINTLNYQYINQDADGEYVFIFDDGFAEKVYIDTGIETKEYTQVLTHFSDNTIFLCGDIKDKDRVIITGG